MRQWMRAALCAAVLAAPAAAEVYEIDPTHSGVNFRVRHLMVSRVNGNFGKFSGTVTYVKDKPKEWKVEALIDAASINTGVEKRDQHLRSADFLDVDKFPTIAFKSNRVLKADGNKAKLVGDLTLHGVTKPVTLDLEIGGTVKDPWGNQRLGATATTKLNRKDFGLTWNKPLETGGVMVGDEVDVTLEIEGIAKK